MPLLINAILFSGLGYYSLSEFGSLLDWILPHWLDWLRWLLWPIFAVILLIGEFYLLSLLANLIASPFNALLAARLGTQLRNNSMPTASTTGVGINVMENVADEIRKLRYQALWALPLLILSFIPPINLIAPFAWFIYGAWMMAIEYLDYPLGEAGLSFPAQKRLLKQDRTAVFGFGAVVLLLSAIPLLNFVMIPVAVAGACRFWSERLSGLSDSLSHHRI
jgi:CysZ protein